MIVCGVDPGLSGALAFVWPGGEAVVDMPVLEITRNSKRKNEVDARELMRVFEAHKPAAVFLEQVGGMQGDSPTAAFQFGRAAGIAEAAAKLAGARFEMVAPHVWKRTMGLIGTAKDDSRAMAQNLFPGLAGALTRRKDDGRAEALLIAEWGRRKLHEQGVFA